MKVGLFLITTFVAAAIPLAAQSKSESAQIVGNAEITKVDAKKKVLEVRELVQPRDTDRRASGGRRGGGGGGGGGGSRRRGGVGFPGGGGGTANQGKEYKVYVLKDTVMKIQDDIKIDFSDLHVGDRIIVSGTPKGSKGDLEATTITRDLR